MKVVAIITRTKDRPLLLKRAFSSIEKQTFKDYVWVIVNDGGDPNPIETIAEEARINQIDVVVIHNQNSLGMEAAANIGIHRSESEFILIHDDDDTVEPLFLERTVSFLKSESGEHYGGVITHCAKIIESIDSNGSCKCLREEPYNEHLSAIYLSEMARVNLFAPICFLYRRYLYDKLNGYDESLPVLGDWEFNLKFLLYSDIYVIRETLANYHLRIKSSKNAYQNTVVDGTRIHQEYDAILRNRLLREDIKSNRIGLGYLVNSSKDFLNISSAVRFVNLDYLIPFISQTKLGRFIRRLIPFK